MIAAALGLFLLLFALQMTTDTTPKPVVEEASHALPDPPPPPAAPDPSEFDLGDGPGSIDLPDFPRDEVAAGELALDLSYGEFEVRPGPVGEPIRVEADFDSRRFTLREEMTERDDGTWRYSVGFAPRGGFLGLLMRPGSGPANRVTVVVPQGHPLSLVGSVGLGESSFDLTGLWLETVDLEAKMGEVLVEFREPSPVPMTSFDMRSRMGEVEIRGLGSASPRAVNVQHRMGELLLDLAGPWVRDAEIETSVRMGESNIWVPSDVRVEIDTARVEMGGLRLPRFDESDNLPEDSPTLRLRAQGGMGELSIERIAPGSLD
ncbi:MAG: hypothetical protein AAGN46_08320 [Acidobacteriota bacterium]